jgi:hypothetical protein
LGEQAILPSVIKNLELERQGSLCFVLELEIEPMCAAVRIGVAIEEDILEVLVDNDYKDVIFFE